MVEQINVKAIMEGERDRLTTLKGEHEHRVDIVHPVNVEAISQNASATDIPHDRHG